MLVKFQLLRNDGTVILELKGSACEGDMYWNAPFPNMEIIDETGRRLCGFNVRYAPVIDHAEEEDDQPPQNDVLQCQPFPLCRASKKEANVG